MRYRLLLVTATLVAAADVLTKALAVALARWMPFRLPGGWSLQVAHNPGVVLGFGAGTIAPDVFAALAVAQIGFLLGFYRRNASPLLAVGLGLIAAAAIGNLGEHQIFGYVVDWICPPQPDIVFNLADVAVACAEVLLLAWLIIGLCLRRALARVAVTQ